MPLKADMGNCVPLSPPTREDAGKAAVSKPEGEPAAETGPAGTLTWDFQTPRL